MGPDQDQMQEDIRRVTDQIYGERGDDNTNHHFDRRMDSDNVPDRIWDYHEQLLKVQTYSGQYLSRFVQSHPVLDHLFNHGVGFSWGLRLSEAISPHEHLAFNMRYRDQQNGNLDISGRMQFLRVDIKVIHKCAIDGVSDSTGLDQQKANAILENKFMRCFKSICTYTHQDSYESRGIDLVQPA